MGFSAATASPPILAADRRVRIYSSPLGSMVTTVVNSLFDRLIEAFPPNRMYGRQELRRNPMPGAVADYLDHLLQVKLQEVISCDPPENVWADMCAPEVEEARNRYLNAVKRHQAVPATAWADALRSACHDTVRFLVRPASTLADMVFDSPGSSVRSEVVFSRIDFFPSGSYLKNVVEAYFEQKGVTRIDRERFEGLVARIDRQMTADFTPDQWLRLLRPLVEVLTAAEMTEVPVDLMKAFLQEKRAEMPLRRLKHHYGLQGYVPLEELEELFIGDDMLEPDPAGPVVAIRAPGRPAAERRQEPVPLWKQFEEGYRPASQAVEPRRVEEETDVSEPLWKQFRKTPRPPAPNDGSSELQDLERTVLGERGARNRDLFVQHLFSGRREDYETTLKRLSQAQSWSQASQIIAQDVFLRHQVNIYSDPAVAFTDAAEAQYRT